MDIAQILIRHWPESEWVLQGGTYDGLEWLSDDEKPSLEQVEALWTETEYLIEVERVEQLRLAAYQSEADPLFFKWQAGEATEEEWIAKRTEIAERFPYPEEENK